MNRVTCINSFFFSLPRSNQIMPTHYVLQPREKNREITKTELVSDKNMRNTNILAGNRTLTPMRYAYMQLNKFLLLVFVIISFCGNIVLYLNDNQLFSFSRT